MKKILFITFILLSIPLFVQTPIVYANEVVYDFMDNYVGPCSATYGCEDRHAESKPVEGYGVGVGRSEEEALKNALDDALEEACGLAISDAQFLAGFCPTENGCRELGSHRGCDYVTKKAEDVCTTGTLEENEKKWREICVEIGHTNCDDKEHWKAWGPYYAECIGAKAIGYFSLWCEKPGTQCFEHGVYSYPQGPVIIIEGFLDLYNETLKSQEKEVTESSSEIFE